MTSAFWGADAGELETLARQVQSAAAELVSIAESLSSTLLGTTWKGPDAEMFLSDWHSVHSRTLAGASEVLRQAASKLDFEARQQMAASGANSGVGASGAVGAAAGIGLGSLAGAGASVHAGGHGGGGPGTVSSSPSTPTINGPSSVANAQVASYAQGLVGTANASGGQCAVAASNWVDHVFHVPCGGATPGEAWQHGTELPSTSMVAPGDVVQIIPPGATLNTPWTSPLADHMHTLVVTGVTHEANGSTLYTWVDSNSHGDGIIRDATTDPSLHEQLVPPGQAPTFIPHASWLSPNSTAYAFRFGRS